MIRINPTKILVSGDVIRARDFIGPAKSQMEILIQDMSFQSLNQSIRRVWLYDDVYIECMKCFNYQECKIYVTPKKSEKKSYFLIIYSTGYGSEAVLWDLLSDTALSSVGSSLEDIRDLLVDFKLFDNVDSVDIEAIYPETDSHIWNVLHPNDEHDSPITLPNYLSGFYGNELGYFWYLTALYPSSFTYNYLDLIIKIEWDFDYIDISPLPYPSKKQIDGEEKETDEKSSYISFFQGRATQDFIDSGDLVNEFETLTGVTWPEDEFGNIIDIWRYKQFWHPFFWYSIKDEQGSYDRLISDGRGIQIADTWADGEWNDDAELIKSSLTWHTGGIATKIVDENIESIIFEYVSVCHKFVDTYGTGMCDKDESTMDEYLRFYEYGKIKPGIMQQGIFDGTNAFRVDNDLHELVYNSVLAESAQRHADDLATFVDSNISAFGHQGSDGSMPNDRITDAGYLTWIDIDLWAYKITENCGYNQGYTDPVAQALIGWRNSPAHWANIIDEQLSEIGVGVAISPGGIYIFVQNFGKVDHRYPGYAPFDPINLKAYVDEHFIFDPEKEDTRMPKVYMIGSIDLTDNQIKILTGSE